MGDDEKQLNELGVLKRREIEARIVAPLLEALGREFGRERVLEVARGVIEEVARTQGTALAEGLGGNSVPHFARSLQMWKKDDALQVDVLEENEEKFSFNVTRCRFAEMYEALGIPELGALLSCNRDLALIGGFNGDIALTRTQTILGGASHCDFRFEKKPASK
jgi:predicted ArsR family transcriptional regulator